MNDWAIHNLAIPARRLWRHPGWRLSVLAFGIGVVVKLAVQTPAPVQQGVQPPGAGGSVSYPPPGFAPPYGNPHPQRQKVPSQGRPGSAPDLLPVPILKVDPAYPLPKGGAKVRSFPKEASTEEKLATIGAREDAPASTLPEGGIEVRPAPPPTPKELPTY